MGVSCIYSTSSNHYLFCFRLNQFIEEVNISSVDLANFYENIIAWSARGSEVVFTQEYVKNLHRLLWESNIFIIIINIVVISCRELCDIEKNCGSLWGRILHNYYVVCLKFSGIFSMYFPLCLRTAYVGSIPLCVIYLQTPNAPQVVV